jgi:hypothetical protein
MFTINFIIPKRIFLVCIVLTSNVIYASDSDPVHIGAATSVVNDVLTPTPAGDKKIRINDDLFFKQQILTKENSTLTITFRDSSTFSVAPQSVVVLDEFIFNPSEGILEKSIKVLKGSFRYISGFPIKNSVTKIVTPFGTAGIRGSAVQGTISAKTGVIVNVASGDVLFETVDGKTLTIKEGNTLSAPTKNEICAVSATSTAPLMQNFVNVFEKTANSPLTPEQILANAEANNMPATMQKEAYTVIRETPINPQSLQGKELPIQSTKVAGDPEVLINKFMQDLRTKNKLQVDSATRDIVAATVASGASTDKIIQIATNAVLGAKGDYKVTVAATVINTLQQVKSSLVNEVAPKVQDALPADQLLKLPSLVPDVVLPPFVPTKKTEFDE